MKKFNCSPKFDQPVKIPDRNIIKSVCDDFQHLLIDRVYSVNELVNVLGKLISQRFVVNVLHATSPEVDPGDINLNAYYDPDDDEACKTAIELILITHPRDDFIIFDEELYSRFIKILADSLAHELIHMRQSRARDFTFRTYDFDHASKEVEYLSDPDEIDAYAYNIVTELNDNPESLKKLNQPSTITIKESVNLWAYFNTFHNNLNSPVLRKLLKKIYKNLDK